MNIDFSFLRRKEFILFEALLLLLLLGAFLTISSGSWDIATDRIVKIILAKMGVFSGKVNDVEATMKKAIAAGGEALVKPFDVPGARMVVLRDPLGAVFEVIKMESPPDA